MTLSGGRSLKLLIIALAFLIAFQILIVGIGFFLRIRDLGEPTRPQLVNQIAAAADLLDGKSAEDRAAALRAVNSPFIRYSLIDALAYSNRDAEPLPRYRPIVEVYRTSMPERSVNLIIRKEAKRRVWGGFGLRGRVDPVDLVFVIGLKDGSGLIVEPSPEYRRQVFINFLALLSSLVGVALLVGLVLASFATTRPLARLAMNAEAFAADLNAPAFDEFTGPEAVRNLARAFNRMQTDIRRLVFERQTTLAAVAHDFRTYLTRLRLRAEFIYDEIQRSKTVADLEEMTALIDDTLFFAKADQARSEVEEVDFADLARNIVAGVAEAGGRTFFSSSGERFQVLAHTRSLKRALANLVENAIKYGGAAHVVLARRGAQIVLTVEDEGPGVPEEKRVRLGEPFFRVDDSRSRETGGAGLGLAIAKMLVQSSGGELTFGAAASGALRAEIILPSA